MVKKKRVFDPEKKSRQFSNIDNDKKRFYERINRK
jgi:hypothetical protein